MKLKKNLRKTYLLLSLNLWLRFPRLFFTREPSYVVVVVTLDDWIWLSGSPASDGGEYSPNILLISALFSSIYISIKSLKREIKRKGREENEHQLWRYFLVQEIRLPLLLFTLKTYRFTRRSTCSASLRVLFKWTSWSCSLPSSLSGWIHSSANNSEWRMDVFELWVIWGLLCMSLNSWDGWNVDQMKHGKRNQRFSRTDSCTKIS